MDSSGKDLFYYMLIVLTLVVAIIITARFAFIMGSGPASIPHQPLVSSRVQRGTIYDRNGVVLAYERSYRSLAVHLRDVTSPEQLAGDISELTDLSADEILSRIEGKSTYALVKKELTDTEYEVLSSALEQGMLKGVVLEKRYGRLYPQGEHGAHLIGFTNIDNVGLEGVEYTYDRLLSPLPLPGEDVTYGKDLYLSIDSRIQYSSDLHLRQLVSEHLPDSAMILVMDGKSGELLAYSSWPTYDLNDYSSSTDTMRLDRPVAMMYEPGSVFKIFSLASILDIGEANTDKIFLCDGSYTFTMDNGQSTTIGCLSPHGEVGPTEVLKYSCNGAISSYALQTDSNQFYQALLRFGFDSPTGIDLPGEISGLLQPPELWSGRSKPTIAFGQEIGTTAIQLTAAATVFTNSGRLLEPRIISRIYDPATGLSQQTSTREVRQVISSDTAASVLQMMASGTETGGTATRAAREGVQVSAKTGTAQILDIESNSYSDDHVLASTIALLPTNDPEYIIYVAADNPKGGKYYGSSVAAPAISRIISDLVAMGLLESDESEYIYL